MVSTQWKSDFHADFAFAPEYRPPQNFAAVAGAVPELVAELAVRDYGHRIHGHNHHLQKNWTDDSPVADGFGFDYPEQHDHGPDSGLVPDSALVPVD